MKRTLCTLLLTLLLLSALPPPAAQAAGTVAVSLPAFAVTLNGQTFSNDYSKYPLLVYRDITYFPMTYYDCRLLGLTTGWSAAAGLSINKGNAPLPEYVREVQTGRNSPGQQARIAGGAVRVNGKTVDNSREQYPLLLFRDVTYFPLTWRFAVEEFGWSYHFDGESGLTISNPAAPFAPAEEWTGEVSEGRMIMGTGSLPVVCMFGAGADEFAPPGTAPGAGIGLYNKTSDPIRILPDSFPWEYQIYRLIGDREELVYRKAIPFFAGEIPEGSFAHWSIDDSFWDGGFAAGDYRCVLVHPESIPYQIVGTSSELLSPVSDSGAYAVVFSHDVTVKS